MISKTLQRRVLLATRRHVFRSNIIHCTYRHRYSTDTSTEPNATPKTFKSSSFSQPKETPPPTAKQTVEVPQEDLEDFRITKLIHGSTDLKIAITKRASKKLTSIAEEENNPQAALKIEVESGGCHGFQYNLVLTDINKELADGKEVLVFKRDADKEIAHIVIDDSSLQILQDSKVDYTKELIGNQFKVVDSPYTSTACGCGASFDFDFEKLEQKKGEK